MLKKTINLYLSSFKGFSSEVWWLTLITFINRAGTMVLPFLSIYLLDQLHFNLGDVGWIMSAFGLGSFLGSWLGGKLTDKFGFYQVMFWSLLTTGVLFILLQFMSSFWGFAIGIFITMMVADTFRPAIFVALKAYSKPENQTRSITLIRLAINLGFSFGPFLGGLIIASLSYKGLFWVDGLTCIIAILLFRMVLKEKKVAKKVFAEQAILSDKIASAYRDKPYLIFLGIVFLMAFTFFQLFSTIPLFYKEVHLLSEVSIGLIMSLNGFLIFLVEMPLIFYIEKRAIDKMKLIKLSLILIALSFIILNISGWFGVLIISMLMISLAEMLGFPFSNVFALNRAPAGKEGQYMALFTMAFSCALVFSSKVGMEVVEKYGYSANWYLMAALDLLAVLLGIWLVKKLKTN